jgi:hypothetical protein
MHFRNGEERLVENGIISKPSVFRKKRQPQFAMTEGKVRRFTHRLGDVIGELSTR